VQSPLGAEGTRQVRKALVIGTGAGGATVARELQGKFQVTVLEEGREFHPFSLDLSIVEKVKKTGLMIDEREIQILFPHMRIRKTKDRSVMVNGIGLGGTTTLATGNAVRVDSGLKECGIDLDVEFEELSREIPISIAHQKRWRPATRRLFEICREMNLNPAPLPKMGDNRKCINCGRCVLGCQYGAKWDSREFLRRALEKGAAALTGWRVEKIVSDGVRALGVKARRGFRSKFFPADLVVLAAGGFGTPAILKNSGFKCENRLFVDPVLCVAVPWKGALQNKEISMPFVVQRDGYILSPYFDYLSYFFNKNWKIPADDTLGMMIKLEDSNIGTVVKNKINKTLTDRDKEKLKEGVAVCRDIFARLGASADRAFLGTVNAGHPGGMMPLTKEEAATFHHRQLPDNLYIADATLFPASLGNPPMLTIMAMAKRVGKICSHNNA
jgi:choline dehydrogenase-like flavoprotein